MTNINKLKKVASQIPFVIPHRIPPINGGKENPFFVKIGNVSFLFLVHNKCPFLFTAFLLLRESHFPEIVDSYGIS